MHTFPSGQFVQCLFQASQRPSPRYFLETAKATLDAVPEGADRAKLARGVVAPSHQGTGVDTSVPVFATPVTPYSHPNANPTVRTRKDITIAVGLTHGFLFLQAHNIWALDPLTLLASATHGGSGGGSAPRQEIFGVLRVAKHGF